MNLRSLPLIIFASLSILLAIGLTLNPRDLPSALVDKPAPDLHDSPTLSGLPFDASELKGKVWLLNVWASWCGSCQYEHKQLVQLTQDQPHIHLIGLNYKDTQAEAEAWLKQHGNPYQQVIFDPTGRLAMDWGVSATPETFVIDATGQVKYKLTGPITSKVLAQLQPVLTQLTRTP